MKTVQAAIAPLPTQGSTVTPRRPAAARPDLRARLEALRDLLAAPPEERDGLRTAAVEAQRAMLAVGADDGLLALLLRNLLADTSSRRGRVDAEFHGGQLTRILERLD